MYMYPNQARNGAAELERQQFHEEQAENEGEGPEPQPHRQRGTTRCFL